ncbi:MAG: hypothetical protein KL863_21245 [Rhizobium sp.]|nr:hypothetical protein [Rhizobium sp.]
MDLTAIITQLVGGAIGGLGGGKVIKDSDLGPIVNLIVGAIGGLGGGALTGQMMGAAPAGGADIGALVAQLVGGGVGGAILQVVVGLIKNKMMAR